MGLKIVCDTCGKDSDRGVEIRRLDFERKVDGAVTGWLETPDHLPAAFCSESCAAQFLLSKACIYRGAKAATEIYGKAISGIK